MRLTKYLDDRCSSLVTWRRRIRLQDASRKQPVPENLLQSTFWICIQSYPTGPWESLSRFRLESQSASEPVPGDLQALVSKSSLQLVLHAGYCQPIKDVIKTLHVLARGAACYVAAPAHRVCMHYTDRMKDRIFFTTRHASEKITIGLPLGKKHHKIEY